ncbi:unnamed protein product, partial [marine sediment metagenome]
MTKNGFTLTELIVVVVILGILATLAIPNFFKVMENTKAKEAVASLHQIRAGEHIYRYEENAYWPSGAGDNAAINAQLNLSLDTGAERNWDYSITADASTFTATATRIGKAADNTITIDEDGEIGG